MAVDALMRDLRDAVRALRKTPTVSIIAVGTLALGLGANVAIFSVADALLARPLRGIDSSRLVVVAIGQKAPAAPADYLDWARLSQSFEELAAYRSHDANLTGVGPAERIYAAETTSNFFSMLRVTAALGRTIQTADETAPIVVLSNGFWQRRFGSDAQIIGRAVDIDGRPYTIAGVMARDFEVPVPTDVWIPMRLTAAERARRDTLTLHVVGRMKPSVTVAQAQAEMATIGRQLEAAYPDTNTNRQPHVMALGEFVQGTITRAAIHLLLALVGVVWLIACVNVAGLQLARAADREREIAVRTALGASGWQIVRLVLVENLLIGAIGGALALLVGSWCVALLLRSMPANIARLIPGFLHIGVDSRACAFTALVTLVGSIVTAAAPAFRSTRVFPSESLKQMRGAAASAQRLRSAFVIAQLAVAFVMLVVGALFVNGLRGVLGLQQVHDPQHVLVLSVNLPQARYGDATSRARFYRAAVDRLAALPGVDAAATFSTIPLSNNGTTWNAALIEGQPESLRTPRSGVVVQIVSPDYFRLLRIPLRQGRLLDATDRADGVPVALVSETAARRYWPRESAVGKRLMLGASAATHWVVVVGIVGDILYDWTDRVPEPTVYLPVSQAPRAAAQLAVRVNGDPTTLVRPARGALAGIDPLLPAFDVMPLSDAIDESLAGSTQIVAMTGMLAALALVIAIVGLYGVISYLVTGRTREFGVRLALGARRVDIAWIVIRRAGALVAVGLGAGLLLAAGTTRVVSGLLFGARGSTAGVWAGVAVVLTAITLIACYVPARRATNADPVMALRAE